MEMKKIGYPYLLDFKSRNHVLIWMDGDESGAYFLGENDIVFVFETLDAAQKELSKSSTIEMRWDEVATLDLDRFFSAVRHLNPTIRSTQRTCELLLEGWNFLDDLVNSGEILEQMQFEGNTVIKKAYGKLFYGNNLDAITPEGGQYSPIWTLEEVVAIKSEIRKLWFAVKRKVRCRGAQGQGAQGQCEQAAQGQCH